VFDRFGILGFKDRSKLETRNSGRDIKDFVSGLAWIEIRFLDLEYLDLDLENGHLGLGNIKNVTGRKLLEFIFIIYHFENPYTLLFLVKALSNLLVKVNSKFYLTQSERLFWVSESRSELTTSDIHLKSGS
jgi:hypothetical protein